MFSSKLEARSSKVKGQHLAEYALILSLVLAVLITMQTYLKRGLQGRYRDATDSVISALREASGDYGLPLQYEPYYVKSELNTTVEPQIRTEKEESGGSKETEIDDTITRTGYQKVYSKAMWGLDE